MLSNVYNTLGYTINSSDSITYNEDSMYDRKENSILLHRKYIKTNEEGWIIGNEVFNNENNLKLNSKGVCMLNYNAALIDDNTIFGIKF